MNLTIQFELEDHATGAGRQVEVDVEYDPARPAPKCSNHDAAEFSDPGESSEIFIVKASYEDGNPVESAIVATDVFHDHVHRAADECYAKGEI